MSVILLLLLVLFTYNLWTFYRRKQEYPAGPFALPIIGNFLQIDTANPHRKLVQWSRKHGDVYTVWLPKPVVVLASMRAIQEALLQNGDQFAGRPMGYLYTMFTGQPDGDGIILCQGPKWQAQRRFALRAFRTFGMGKRQMESRIFVHLQLLMQQISRAIRQGSGVTSMDLHHALALCFGNIIHDLVMGRHYAENDEEFVKFKQMLDNTLEGVASIQMLLVDSFPFLRFFLPSHRRYLREGLALQKFFLDEIHRHEQTIDEVKEPSNFIDCYLKDMESGEHPYLNKMTLTINSGDLWTGGLETVVTTIRWGILYMVHNPDIQHSIQKELDEKVGLRPLELIHRQQTPYLHATIDELQRIVNVLPWNIPHALNGDTVICGRRIKAGVTVMPQIGCVHFDERLFPDPERFNPLRFLDEQGNYKPSNNLIPFGLGKRACAGESLARMELFLVFGTLLQNFTFEIDPSVGLPSLERSPGMTSVPKPTTYIIKQRFKNLTCQS